VLKVKTLRSRSRIRTRYKIRNKGNAGEVAGIIARVLKSEPRGILGKANPGFGRLIRVISSKLNYINININNR
jgi:hypothetical protein